MNFNINEIYDQIATFIKGLSKKTKKMILIATAVVLVASVSVALILNNKPYEMLFGGLTTEESSEIMGKLQELGVAYKYDQNGTISVPKNEEPKLKAQLISEGYPKSGFTYDVFKENINMMSTDFEKQSYKLYELQTRMEATIRLFDGVKDATVNIAPAEDTKYVLSSDTKSTATASVVVLMNGGGSPSAEQARGIQKLVAGGIQGMESSDVTVIDGNGQEVVATDSSSQIGITRLKLEIQKEVESSVKSKVLHMLEPIFGTDKVRVSVSSVMDLDKKIKEVIDYIPYEETGKGIISNENTSSEISSNGNITGGVPGADTNADITTYPGITTDGDEIYIRDEKSMDYLVSQVKEQIQSDSGELKDLTVTVVVDSNTVTDSQMESLEALVATTAGISPDVAAEKVEIYNIAFPKGDIEVLPEDVTGVSLWIIIAVAAVTALLVIIIVLIIAKLRKKKKKSDIDVEIDEVPDEFIENLKEITQSRDNMLKDQISDFTSTNPEIAAQLIKSWLKGDDK